MAASFPHACAGIAGQRWGVQIIRRRSDEWICIMVAMGTARQQHVHRHENIGPGSGAATEEEK